MTTLRKTIAGTATALAITAGIAASTSPAEAYWRGHRGGWGGPVAAGVIGGLALGAFAAQAAGPRYYGPAYGYGPTPVYGECFNRRRPVYDRWGNFAGYRVVRVCR